MIDVDLLQADDRTTFKVYVAGGLGEDGNELPDSTGFVIVGPHSAEFQKAQAKLGAKAMKMLREKPTETEAPDLDDEAQWVENNKALIERAHLVSQCCVVDFFGFGSGKTPLPFSEQALVAILTKRPLWAFMVMRASEHEANFTKG